MRYRIIYEGNDRQYAKKVLEQNGFTGIFISKYTDAIFANIEKKQNISDLEKVLLENNMRMEPQKKYYARG